MSKDNVSRFGKAVGAFRGAFETLLSRDVNDVASEAVEEIPTAQNAIDEKLKSFSDTADNIMKTSEIFAATAANIMEANSRAAEESIDLAKEVSSLRNEAGALLSKAIDSSDAMKTSIDDMRFKNDDGVRIILNKIEDGFNTLDSRLEGLEKNISEANASASAARVFSLIAAILAAAAAALHFFA